MAAPAATAAISSGKIACNGCSHSAGKTGWPNATP